MVALTVGMVFKDFKSLDKHFKNYQDEVKQSYIIGKCHLSTQKQFSHCKIDTANFPYYYIRYDCHFGGSYDSQSTGKRKTQ